MTGYPVTHAFYGENIPGYFTTNNGFKEIIHGSARMAEAAAVTEIPDGTGGIKKWYPVSDRSKYVQSKFILFTWLLEAADHQVELSSHWMMREFVRVVLITTQRMWIRNWRPEHQKFRWLKTLKFADLEHI